MIEFGEADDMDEGDQALPEEDFGMTLSKEELSKIGDGIALKKAQSRAQQP